MQKETWRYYNHAMIPATSPHEKVDEKVLRDKSFWKKHRKALFARYTTNFDCNEKTSWWYVIKDTSFDISMLKSKRRYEINKGNKNFNVIKINASEHIKELYEVTVQAYQSWPERYRPSVTYEEFQKSICKWQEKIVYGAYHKEKNCLCGYAMLTHYEDYIDFNILRVIPEYEKYAINAAIVYKIVMDNNEFINNGGYICDGSRSISHETMFQDYLEKYFEFRKAYCYLNIVYNPIVGFGVKVIYPIRGLLKYFDGISIIHKVNSVLKMEEIRYKKM